MDTVQIQLDTQVFAYHLRIVCVSEQIEKQALLLKRQLRKEKNIMIFYCRDHDVL